MGKKNDIRLSKRENHKVPNSEARGLLNSVKKQGKASDQNHEGGFLSFLMKDKKTLTYIHWLTRIALGYWISGSMNGYDNPAIAYWVVYLSLLVTIDSYKKEK